MFSRNKAIKEARKAVGDGGDVVVDLKKFQAKDLQGLGDLVGEEGSGKGKGKGRGRRRKRNVEDVDGDGDGNAKVSEVVVDGVMGDDLADVDADLEDLDDDDVGGGHGDKHRNKRAKSQID